MNNRDYVRGAYDEIHAPDALFGKVMDMKNKEVKKFDKRNVLKYAAAFAAIAVAFAGSNGICYAATGETWVEKAYVYINGEKQETDITYTQQGDEVVGELQLEVDENDDVVVSVVDEAHQTADVTVNGEKQEQEINYTQEGDTEVGDIQLEVDEDDDVEVSLVEEVVLTEESTDSSMENTAEIKNGNGKVYLVVLGETVDITEDFADGEAAGQVDCDGEIVNYTVTGTADAYEISLESNK